MDSIDSAFDLMKNHKCKYPIILNMESDFNPGGGVRTGKGNAQEESLFKHTNYHKGFHHNIKSHRYSGVIYPFRETTAVYTYPVSVIKNSSYEMYRFSNGKFPKLGFIAVAGIRQPILHNNNNKFNDTDEKLFHLKVEQILQSGIMENNNHDSIVLGAIGCGAFNGPAKQFAEMFAEHIPRLI